MAIKNRRLVSAHGLLFAKHRSARVGQLNLEATPATWMIILLLLLLFFFLPPTLAFGQLSQMNCAVLDPRISTTKKIPRQR